MQLFYGSYGFTANSNEIRTRRDFVYNQGGQAVAQKIAWDVGGFLYSATASQAAITAAMLALETALTRPFQNLIFYHDDGTTPSATLLLNRGSSTGVRITAGPHYDRTHGSEYSLERHFTFTAEAEYPLPQALKYLMDFHEQVSFSGGGPVRVARRALNGPAQIQMPYKQTEFRAVQSGTSVGYLAYPNAPAPLWPNALEHAPDTVQRSPKRMGLKYQEFPIEWKFSFVSAKPLYGIPTRWT